MSIDNLLGGIHVVPGTEPGVLRVEAHIVAEAKSAEQAAGLADSIRLDSRVEAGETRLHVAFPLERHTAYRAPKAGVKGWLSRWTGAIVRGKSFVEYDGKQVAVGKDRKAAGLAVYLTVTLPYDTHATISQAVGAIEGRALSGQIHLKTVHGNVLAQRFFGTLTGWPTDTVPTSLQEVIKGLIPAGDACNLRLSGNGRLNTWGIREGVETT